MRKILIALLAVGFASSLGACTSKGSNLVPLVSQQHPSQPVSAMDNGGGPSQNCGEQACSPPDPTPTP